MGAEHVLSSALRGLVQQRRQNQPHDTRSVAQCRGCGKAEPHLLFRAMPSRDVQYERANDSALQGRLTAYECSAPRPSSSSRAAGGLPLLRTPLGVEVTRGRLDAPGTTLPAQRHRADKAVGCWPLSPSGSSPSRPGSIWALMEVIREA